MYTTSSSDGLLPDLPHANIFFHCFSTAILFHAAVLEPHNLRSSYWKFLQSVSGGTMGLIDRHCLETFGLKSVESFERVIKKYKLIPLQVIKF